MALKTAKAVQQPSTNAFRAWITEHLQFSLIFHLNVVISSRSISAGGGTLIKFSVTEDSVILKYRVDNGDNSWVRRELNARGGVTLSKVFSFDIDDLIAGPDGDDTDISELFDGDADYQFMFATRADGYFRIEGRVFDIPNTVLIADEGLRLDRKVFVAERGISILRKIANLIAPDQVIAIGGELTGSIPITDFQILIDNFPTSTELDHYAAARVATVVGDYISPLKDARAQYETYLSRRRSTISSSSDHLPQTELLLAELEKYTYIRKTIAEWLSDGAARSEGDWQKMILNFLLLIFPKYVAVLSNVKVADVYSSPGSTKDRYIDLALIDASGNLDVIEIKKPFDDALLRRTQYRDNYIPTKELSGCIMQAEKYLFHLSKWGRAGESKLSQTYASAIPAGMNIHITNPKAMIILGRDRLPDGSAAFDAKQSLDLEIIKRKYANMIDVMTYDDLLRRLDNIIAALRKRVGAPEQLI